MIVHILNTSDARGIFPHKFNVRMILSISAMVPLHFLFKNESKHDQHETAEKAQQVNLLPVAAY